MWSELKIALFFRFKILVLLLNVVMTLAVVVIISICHLIVGYLALDVAFSCACCVVV